ncbi:C39 family peptidase [Mycobacterium sp. SP-6446]|uniref:C39 family peptidase n=1 Tax=Mycobacterium sp. SP-6446 TaxID=1834162 RepID=UPI0009F9E810|nr:C39 family peptidase [Mycobacterium sp. SP-6446]
MPISKTDARTLIVTRAAAVVVCLVIATAPAMAACGSGTSSTSSSTSAAPSLATSNAASPAAEGAPSNSPSTPQPTAGPGVYGDPGAAMKFWRAQSKEDNCGLMAVSYIVGERTGNQPSEQEMITLAQSTPSSVNPGTMIYAASNDPSHEGANGGVSVEDLVVLLDHFGIKSAMTYGDQTSMEQLQQYLGGGRKVIAWVNSTIIGDQTGNSTDQRTKADHYVEITAIDTNKQIVHLSDPGVDHADEQIPVATFTSAWQTGQDTIVATAPPA